MLTGDNAEKKWREKNVEGDNDLRTVECLRGRLLAERTASRVAKEEAELMQNKLIELERQLKAEIKSKNRAEKKLKFLTKRLESLQLPPIAEHSSSLETNPELKNAEEEKPNSEIASSTKCNRNEDIGGPGSGITDDSSYDNKDCLQEEAGKVDETVYYKEQGSTNDLGLSKEALNDEKESIGENDSADYVDNSLAIVPVDMPTAPTVSQEPKIIYRESVGDVLSALRIAREKLHSSMRRRDGNHGFHSCTVELYGRV